MTVKIGVQSDSEVAMRPKHPTCAVLRVQALNAHAASQAPADI